MTTARAAWINIEAPPASMAAEKGGMVRRRDCTRPRVAFEKSFLRNVLRDVEIVEPRLITLPGTPRPTSEKTHQPFQG